MHLSVAVTNLLGSRFPHLLWLTIHMSVQIHLQLVLGACFLMGLMVNTDRRLCFLSASGAFIKHMARTHYLSNDGGPWSISIQIKENHTDYRINLHTSTHSVTSPTQNWQEGNPKRNAGSRNPTFMPCRDANVNMGRASTTARSMPEFSTW